MKYGIIAAGEGSRLAAEGVVEPKPLVKIGGERLIDRLVRIFMANGAEEIAVVCNDLSPAVADHLRELGRRAPLRIAVKTTPSSMHSFFEISPWLDGGGPFCLTTVDTIFREEEFATYIKAFAEAVESGEADGLMGVTGYIDDEKPLYVDADERMNIRAFADPPASLPLISAGIYGLTPPAIATLRRCVARGESRMRNLQRALLADGLRLKAHCFSKVLDVDHASDIAKAESFLISESLGVKGS